MRKPQTKAASREQIHAKLTRLYGLEQADSTIKSLFDLIDSFQQTYHPHESTALSEKDVILITYGDQVSRESEPPLSTLHMFLKETVSPTINSVHILPFFPYSSDDGFSVIDYLVVDPALGNWEHIQSLQHDFHLMFDAVFNHISAKSDWFQAFLRDEAPYNDYFIVVDPTADLSKVVRPRALPLLTRFETTTGKEKYVWTTFSEDQIDLDFANPAVLLKMMQVLLYYVQQGASLIRLDAIAFLWKIIGTTCIHLEETHRIIQLMRDVLDIVAPHVLVITETNVPHEENISYFGDGNNEAQMVYQFPLAPLLLHTFRTGSTQALTQWAAALERVSETTTYFNFTASHDGIGLRPVTGILSDEEIDALVNLTKEHTGFVSYKTNSDGSQSPYELNITYFDAITHPDITAAQPEIAVQRFIASQAIALTMIGVPGIYFHNLFGGRNYLEGVEKTGRYRTINREKLNADQLLTTLNDTSAIRQQVFTRYRELLAVRTQEPAFHPLGYQEVLSLDPAVFAVKRSSPDRQHLIIALTNVTDAAVNQTVPTDNHTDWQDIIAQKNYTASPTALELTLQPYQSIWLKPL